MNLPSSLLFRTVTSYFTSDPEHNPCIMNHIMKETSVMELAAPLSASADLYPLFSVQRSPKSDKPSTEPTQTLFPHAAPERVAVAAGPTRVGSCPSCWEEHPWNHCLTVCWSHAKLIVWLIVLNYNKLVWHGFHLIHQLGFPHIQPWVFAGLQLRLSWTQSLVHCCLSLLFFHNHF